MTVVLIFCAAIAVLSAAATAWALQTVTDLARAATRGRDSLEAAMKAHRTITARMDARLDALTNEFHDFRAGLEPPAPVKKAAPRKAPAAKKGPAK